MWPTGGAWLATHLWQHYLFEGDREFLEEHYPALKGAALFFVDALVEEPKHGWLVTCPSVSPELAPPGHGTSVCAGPTMDLQIIRDLLSHAIDASETLGLDAELRETFRKTRSRLAPMQIGKHGQLQEWLEDWDDPNEKHRHVSHLYGLHPSNQITKRGTPELFAAARRSLLFRGDGGTGWSMAWKINFWARLEDGDHAFSMLSNQLTPGRTYPNLFDAHPPFQIDGNFGATSGMAEMLVQSHAGEIHLLPALPSAWPHGRVRGLRARGAFELDILWRDGALVEAKFRSLRGNPARVRCGERLVELETEAGKEYRLDGALQVLR
jgi:alpha-L-fucosidase 2